MTTMRYACAVWARLLVILSLEMAIAGCSGAATATPPPFELGKTKVVKEGDPAAQHGAAYSIRITSPREGARYNEGDEIEVVCELTVPAGGSMPASIIVELLGRKERSYDSVRPRPAKKRGDGIFLLTGQLTCPRLSGAFKIVAKGNDTVLLLPSNRSTEKISSKDRISNRLVSSDPITVRVK